MKYALVGWLALVTKIWAGGLTFENTFQEVNADLDAKIVTTDYKFTNNSEKDITIATADGGCSCMKVEVSGGKMTYKPGESGVLRSTFEVGGFLGTVDKAVAIHLQGDPIEKPSHVIQLRVHIPMIITLTPKTLKWDVGEAPNPKTIRVDMDYENPIHITSVATNNEDFMTEIVELEKGKRYDVKVTPKKTDVSAIALLRILTDVDVERHRSQQAFASIRATLP